jgi:hypothetical protein
MSASRAEGAFLTLLPADVSKADEKFDQALCGHLYATQIRLLHDHPALVNAEAAVADVEAAVGAALGKDLGNDMH